jgi:hypothetical protein
LKKASPFFYILVKPFILKFWVIDHRFWKMSATVDH